MKSLKVVLVSLCFIYSNALSSQNCLLSPNQFAGMSQVSSIDGSFAIIGSEYSGANSNKVHFYAESNDIWTLTQTIANPDTLGGQFGYYDIDISGDYAIVGATNAAFFLKRDAVSGLWNVEQQVLHNNSSAFSGFGQEVKIDGDIAVVSAKLDSELYSYMGAVYVYERDGSGIWNQVQIIYPSGQDGNNYFGDEIDLVNSTLVVKCSGINSYLGSNTAVYIYEKDSAGVWNELQSIISPSYIDGLVMNSFQLAFHDYDDTHFFGKDGSGNYVEVQVIDGYILDLTDNRAVFTKNEYEYDSGTIAWVHAQGHDYIWQAEISGDRMVGRGVFYSCNSSLCYAHMSSYYAQTCSDDPEISVNIMTGGGTGPFTLGFDTDTDGIADITHTSIPNDTSLIFTVSDTMTLALVSALDESNGNYLCSVTGTININFVGVPDLTPMGTLVNTCPDDFVDLTSLPYVDNNPVSAADTNAIFTYKYINNATVPFPEKVCESGFIVVSKYSNGCSASDTVYVDLQDCAAGFCMPKHQQWITKHNNVTSASSGEFLIVGDQSYNSPAGGIATLYKQDTNGTWIEVEEFESTATNTTYSGFGRTVSIDGDYMAIGAWVEGAVYMYEKSGGTFVFSEKFSASSGFGYTVKIKGNQMLVGYQNNSYSALLYERDASGNWVQGQAITLGSFRGSFGSEFDFNEDIITIYSRHNNYNDSIYVFEENGAGLYEHTQSLDSPQNTNYSYFAERTSISNNRIAATLPSGNNRGVYLFEKDSNGNWLIMDTIPVGDLRTGNDIYLDNDTLFIGVGRYVDHYIHDGTDWDFKKRYIPHQTNSGYRVAQIHYENENLWASNTGAGVEYWTCEDYDCLAEFSRQEWSLCESNWTVPLSVNIYAGVGPYTVEIDTTGDGSTDWTINNYFSGAAFYDQPVGVDTFTYDLVSVLDEGDNSQICNLGLGLIIINSPRPDLAPVPPQTNTCPSNSFDLTAVTLVDNNPLTSGFAAEYIYTKLGSATPIEDPTNITIDGLYRITKRIGACTDYVEFLVDILNCPNTLCNLQPVDLFYPDTLDYNFRFSNFEFDGATAVGRRQIGTVDPYKLFVYEKGPNGNYELSDTIVEPNATSNFGFRFTVLGDYIAVGDLSDDTNGTNAGAVYMYKKDAGTGLWNFDSKLIGSDAGVNDSFGVDLTMDGNKLVVTSKDYNSGIRGAIYVFELNASGTWVEIDKSIPSTVFSLSFGNSIEMDGDFIVVGDTGYQGNAINSGGVCLFKNNGSDDWIEHQVITASNGATSDWFGRDMAIENGSLIIGAHQNDAAATNAGAAYVYEENSSGVFVETQILLPVLPAAQFGKDVSLSGDRLVVVEATKDVRVYEKPASSWTELQNFNVNTTIESCEIVGDELLVGLPTFQSANGSGGLIRVYSCENSNCGAIIYGNRAACYTSTYLTFEAFSGIGPFEIELDANDDGIADVTTTVNNNVSNIFLNISQEVTFTLLSVTDVGRGSEICDVHGTVTLFNHFLDQGEIGPAQEICSGDNAALLSFTTPATSLPGITQRRWYKKTANTGWTQVLYDGLTYDPGVLTETTDFYCLVYSDNTFYGSSCLKSTPIITIFVGDTSSPEICDGFDNDCNGLIDDGLTLNTYYRDADFDSFGDINVTIDTCLATPPSGWVIDNTDCNDNCNVCYPGALDLCNSIDEDCDGIAMENCSCPDIRINSIVIDTVQASNSRVYYTAEIENIGVDTVFLSLHGVQNYYSDDDIILNGDEVPAGGFGSAVFGVDTVANGDVVTFSYYATNGNFLTDPTPHLILDITGIDCDPSNDIDIVSAECPNCLFCDYDIGIINHDITPLDTLSDYKWSANQHMIMDGVVLPGSGADTFVDLTAGNYILLNPGFESQLGTRTHIYITPCDPSQLPIPPINSVIIKQDPVGLENKGNKKIDK